MSTPPDPIPRANLAPEQNPYASPVSELGGFVPAEAVSTEAENVRHEYLKHEASVKSIGILLYLGGGLLLILFVASIITMFSQGVGRRFAGSFSLSIFLTLFYLIVGSGDVIVAAGIRRLKTWARWTAVAMITLLLGTRWVFAILGIMSANRAGGVGTAQGNVVSLFLMSIIPIYCLYLLLSEKSKMVFSDYYRQIVADTPHIRYKTSVIVKVFLYIILGLILIGVVGAIFSAAR